MKRYFSIAICSLLFIAAALWPQIVAESCRSGMSICARSILPSLFPFFVLCGMMSRMGLADSLGRMIAPLARKLYGVSGAGATALAVGLTGGYPMGAAYIAQLRRQELISADEGESLLAFCNNSGPAFIIGAIGSGALGSGKMGIYLYFCHIASALICGLFFRRKPQSDKESPSPAAAMTLSQALPPAVRSAVSACFNVCGFVVSFTVFTALLDIGGYFSRICSALGRSSGMGSAFFRAALTGILELGSGAAAVQLLSPSPLVLALAAAMLGWGGLSVQFQTRAVLDDCDIKGALHLAGRLISASISMLLAYCFSFVVL